MTSICVVMAVHNRIDSVHCALHSWALQTRKGFSVVVADDASTEDMCGLVKEYMGALNVFYVSTGGSVPRTVPVALNVGTKAVPLETTHLWYTDGDIIFNSKAMQVAYEHIALHPNRVITGRYDWMPPMIFSPQDLERDFQGFVDCRFPRRDVDAAHIVRRVDHRTGSRVPNWFQHQLLDSCRPILGANVIMPVQAWYDIGGWDEHIPGANANDCDFGWCLTDAGYHLLTCECIIGYHQWHPRDIKTLELFKVSLPYIFRKHGEEVPDQWKPYDTFKEKNCGQVHL